MSLKLLSILLVTGTVFAQVDVPTRRVDNSRSGVNSHETVLTQDAVRTRFGKLWTLFADAKIMAQPLYVSNLVVPAPAIIGAVSTSEASSASVGGGMSGNAPSGVVGWRQSVAT